MNQLIKCPFCQDLLAAHSVNHSSEEIIVTWFCDVCHCEVDRWVPYSREELNSILPLIDNEIVFKLGECDE